jgi:peptidoglycan hydrolase-like protein with peptidoglycan-binding domain
MKKLLTALLTILFACAMVPATQNTNTPVTASKTRNANSNRKPIFRATADQIKQAQGILKQRGFYAGVQTGTLDQGTRDGLKKYQEAEGLKATGTLNKVTLDKMGIVLSDKQKAT